MNRTRFVLFLLLTSAWLGVAGHRALAAQLVPLGDEDEVPSDLSSNPPAVADQPDGSYLVAWDDHSRSTAQGGLPSEVASAAGAPRASCRDFISRPTRVPAAV